MNKRVLTFLLILLTSSLVVGLILSLVTVKKVKTDVDLIFQSINSPFDKNNVLLVDDSQGLIINWNPSSGTKSIIPKPKDSIDSWFYIYSSENNLIFVDKKSNIFVTSHLPQNTNEWKKLGLKVTGSVIGITENNIVFYNDSKNQVIGNDLDSGKNSFTIDLGKKESNETYSSFYSLNTPTGKLYLITSNYRVISFDPSLQTKFEGLKSNSSEITGAYSTKIVETKSGNIYIFVTNNARGTYFSDDYGKSYTLVQKNLSSYQLSTIFYQSQNDRIVGITPTGKHVYSFNPANLSWKNIPVEKVWNKIP